MREILKRGVLEHSVALAQKEYSSEELTEAYLERIDECNSQINAFITVTKEEALNEARKSDQRRARKEILGVLDGIPMALKDNICTRGIKTTCASKMLENYAPPYTATAAKRLILAGGILLGKLNMDEFAMGSTSETSFFGAVKNPLDQSRTAGGSSGGSAAAVADFQVPYTLGSDTGGSLRQPAAFCGLVAMKPTYSRVSRYGLMAFASSLDQIGPITRTVRDNAIVLNAIAGKDDLDPTSSPIDTEHFEKDIEKSVSELVIGLPKELFGDNIAPDVRSAVLSAVKLYTDMGAKINEISIPRLTNAPSAYYIISSAEASSNLARLDGIRYGAQTENCIDLDSLYSKTRSEAFGKEVKRRIMLGTFVLSAEYCEKYYARAQQLRNLIREDLKDALTSCDIILSPTTPTTAYRLGIERNSATEIWADDLCTVPANISSLPALSVPCGTGDNGMPIGVQLIGSAFSEALLYRAAHALESARRAK